MTARVLILDFDGTLVETVGVKDTAFRELFSDRKDKLDEIMDYHLSHNHTIRFDKFRHITEDILGQAYDSAAEERLSRRFAELVYRGLVEAPEVPGAREFLTEFSATPTYLVSMSPEDELRSVLEAKGLGDRFADVYAYPWTKAGAVADILRREHVRPEEALMVGDSPEDAEVAHRAGVTFVGRDSGKLFPPGVHLLEDLRRVLTYIKNLNESSGGVTDG